MKTKDLMIYSINSHHNKKRFPTLKTFLTKKFLHQITSFFVLFTFLSVNCVPLRVLADELPSSVTIDAVSSINAEAVSASGSPVSFSLPAASEYDADTSTTGAGSVTCTNAPGDVFPIGVTTVTCTGVGTAHPELSAQTSFTVTVHDTTAPSITLNGPASMLLPLHDTFSDQGAVASDTVSGDLTSLISVAGMVDMNATGTYTLTYSVSDTASNTASVVRTVTVFDASSSTPSQVDGIILATSAVGGSISPSGTTTVPYGTDVLFVIVPDAGKEIDVLTVDGASVVATTSYTFSQVISDHTIDVTFRDAATSTDTIPPTGPAILESGSHTVSASTTTQDVIMSWDSASDETTLFGYSYLFDHEATTTPDNVVDGTSNGLTETLSPGTWYFHIQAVDASGNVGPSLHFGPILIDNNGSGGGAPDTTPPSGLSIVSSNTHQVEATSSAHLVTMSWNEANDSESAFGYSFVFDHEATTTPDMLTDTSATTTSTTLVDGTWYFHVMAVDSASNASPALHYGPFVISDPDITAPSMSGVMLTNLGGGSFKASWASSTDDRSLSGYSYAVAEGSVEQPDSVVDSDASTTEVTFIRPDGVWYFSIAAIDATGNMSPVSSDAILLDGVAPTSPLPTLVKEGGNTLRLSWGQAFDAVGVASYKYAFATSTGSAPTTVISSSTRDVSLSVLDGTWYGSVTALDSTGNESTVGTTTGVLVDTVLPVVSLVGSPVIMLTLGDSYIEQGATASDSHDGDLTSSIVTSGTVDTSVAGTSTISYTAIDGSGNSASIVRTVVVTAAVDSIPPGSVAPTITKTGASSVELSWNLGVDNVSVLRYEYTLSSLEYPTYIASSTTSTSTGSVTLPDGLWHGTVKVVDTSLNESSVSTTSDLRVDTTLPVLTLNGGDTVSIPQGGVFTDPGVTAADSVDGDLTSSVIRVGTVFPAFLGTYTLRYSVEDSSGNTGEVVRYVVVTVPPDATPPSRPLLSLSKQGNSELRLSWIPSTDDTGVTEYVYGVGTTTSPATNITVSSSTDSVTVPVSDGTWYASLIAKDAAGNESVIATSSMVLIDTLAPEITLTGSSTLTIYQNSSYIDQGATATDSVDGDISSSIITAGTVDTSTLGSYTLTYSVSDASGNQATPVSRTVTVVLPPDTTAPTAPSVSLTKTGSSTLTLSWGGAIDERGIDAYEFVLATSTTAVPSTSVSSSTSSQTLTVEDGLWYGLVRAYDSSGNSSIIASSSGVLIDTIAPSITLDGSLTVSVYQGRSYVEAGAVAIDDHDGDISSSIVRSGSVDTSILGSYTFTYAVSDTSGNAAQVTRTVTVIPLVYFPITASILSGKGSIQTGASSSIAINDPYTLTVLPNNGYEVGALLLDGVPQATSSTYTLADVTGSHHIDVSFAPRIDRNSYPLSVTHTGRGSTTPQTTSTLLEGEDEIVSFHPGYLYDIGSITVNGLSVATSSSYTITNASSSNNIVVSFVPTIVDVTPPTDVLAASSSVTVKVPTDTQTLSFSWYPSADADAGVEGYSYLLDQSQGSDPDDIIDGSATTFSSSSLPYGTYYFHIKALDYLGNVSGVTHFGPYLLSDSQVVIENSSINGNTIAHYSPTLSTATLLGFLGSTTITNSTTTGSLAVNTSNIASSSIVSGSLVRSSVSDSTLTSIHGTDSTLVSVIADSSTLTTTRATSSSLTSSVFTNSFLSNTLATSTSAVDTILSGNSEVGSSTLLHHLRGAGAKIYNDVVTAGDFLMPDGTTYTATESRPVTEVQNNDPIAEIVPYVSHEYTVAFVSSTTDKDLHSTVFKDRWIETFDFGDGSPVISTTTNKLSSQFIHTYRTHGPYTIHYTVQDLFGSISSYTRVYVLPDPYAHITQRGSGGGNPPAPLSMSLTLPSVVTTKTDDKVSVDGKEVVMSEKPLIPEDKMVDQKPLEKKEIKKAVTKKAKVEKKTSVKKTPVSTPLSARFVDKAVAEEVPLSSEVRTIVPERTITKKVKEFFSSFLPW